MMPPFAGRGFEERLENTSPTTVRRRADSAPAQLRASEHPPVERPRLQLAELPATSSSELSPPPLTAADGRPISVVHLAPELAPFARTGGLGEAVASIAKYQAATGMPTALIMPLYAAVRDKGFEFVPVGDAFEVPVGPRVNIARLYQLASPSSETRQPRVYFIENPEYFDRPGLYGASGADYADNGRRYAFFCLAALLALPRVAASPVILHAHDWQTSLAPIYLRGRFTRHPYYRQVSTVLTVHNAGYQGHFAPDTLADIGLPFELFNWRQLEWHGRVNLLKGGLTFADMVTTVSSTHAYELRTPSGGFGLDGVFVSLRDRLIGIANGIDQTVWDPHSDREIPATYSIGDLAG